MKLAMPDDRVGRLFVIAAIVEAFTWAGLLIGMLFKHVLDITDMGVTVFGAIHGLAFMVYGGLALLCFVRFGWSFKLLLITGLAAIPPFTTIPMERWLRRNSRLDEPVLVQD